jgi:phenylalanine-4-hydroxylase
VELHEQRVTEVGHVGTAHGGDEVVLAGAHHQRLDALHLDDGVADLAPTVLSDLQEDQRADPVAEQGRVERGREPGDRPDPAQPLDAGVGGRAGDVATLGEVGERHPTVGHELPENGPIDVVDLSSGTGDRRRNPDILIRISVHGRQLYGSIATSWTDLSRGTRMDDVTTYDTDSSQVEVVLADDHPGVSDPDYLRRRNEIAQAAVGLKPGDEARNIDYNDDENRTWETAVTTLRDLHAKHAARAYLDGVERLALPSDRVPQLAEVSRRLQRLTGWRVEAAPGLAPIREFYGSLGERRFLSTQYVRHPSVPLYTPEPDVIHEVVGHCNSLANTQFADLYATAGAASTRADDDALVRFSKTFWFTLEFGVVHENGDLKAYGAGLLSSFGEMNAYRDAEIRDWDPDAMAVTDYDINHYQPVLFAAPDFGTIVTDLTAWFEAL